eukprot:45015_1
MSTKDIISKWSCTPCQLTENINTSKCEMCAKKQIIISLMYDLKDNNEDVKGFMFNLIDDLDDDNDNNNNKQDEKSNVNDNQYNVNKTDISLLADTDET